MAGQFYFRYIVFHFRSGHQLVLSAVHSATALQRLWCKPCFFNSKVHNVHIVKLDLKTTCLRRFIEKEHNPISGGDNLFIILSSYSWSVHPSGILNSIPSIVKHRLHVCQHQIFLAGTPPLSRPPPVKLLAPVLSQFVRTRAMTWPSTVPFSVALIL